MTHSALKTFLAVGAAIALMVSLAGCAAQQAELAPAAERGAAIPVATAGAAEATYVPSGKEVSARFAVVQRDLIAALDASRALLLGKRDPSGSTCQPFKPAGHTDAGYKGPPKGDLDGGPGNRMLQIYYWQHMEGPKSATEDFRWHQTTLRHELETMRARSRDASARLRPVLAAAAYVADALSHWREVPQDMPLHMTDLREAAPWPEHCRARLEDALCRRDVAAAKRWSRELHAALFALEDLHRWLEFVATNQLANLDYQKLGESLFTECQDDYGGEDQEPYSAPAVISRFPGGSLCVTALNNYFEIERQAEGLFKAPREYTKAADAARDLTVGPCEWPADKPAPPRTPSPAAVWMPPPLRDAFIEMRERLGALNQRAWDRAASLPYERSFVANHLHRAKAAGVLDALGTALERFSARHRKATVAELMDILPYRASLGMAGLEWGDRYDARLMEASRELTGDDRRTALLSAHWFAQHDVYKGKENYKGMVLTLRKALDDGKYDCIRGTDMIAAVYRNAGWPGFLNVRWCRGTSAHTIGAVEVAGDGGERRILTVDSLFPTPRAQGAWPDSYVTGHRDLYSVQLNGRGLDNYVWLEGYILRGPNAGALVKAAVPYLPGHEHAGRTSLAPGGPGGDAR